uniref:Uncharacterized protein n=1 Tax=Nothobranchius kadleci TaxID=1051664 RepID=A0A1A8EEC8_NOTKA
MDRVDHLGCLVLLTGPREAGSCWPSGARLKDAEGPVLVSRTILRGEGQLWQLEVKIRRTTDFSRRLGGVN